MNTSIPVQYTVKFLSTGCWTTLPTGVHIMTAYDPRCAAFALIFSADTDLIVMKSVGISSYSVKYGLKEGDAMSINREEELPIVSVEGKHLSNSDSNITTSMAGATYHNIIIKTPYPCKRADLYIESKDEEFPCLLSIKAFSSTYSSSMSTPISKISSKYSLADQPDFTGGLGPSGSL